jgi:glycerophosphoryl diester phosphodiesterase
VEVVTERLGVTLDPSRRKPQAAVARGGHEQAPAGRQHPPYLNQPPRSVGHVLDHLTGPDDVERAVTQRQRPIDLHEVELEPGVSAPRPVDRRLSDLDPQHLGASLPDQCREVALPAAQIENPVSRRQAGVEKAAPQLQVRGLEVSWQSLPELLVVIPHGVEYRAPDRFSIERDAMTIQATDSRPTRCLRVGHSIIKAGSSLGDLPARLGGSSWDMVELDVLTHRGRLVVAHDAEDLALPDQIDFLDALRALRELLPESVELDVDVKATGYESEVVAALRSLELTERALVSSMELDSLRALRSIAPELRLGWSVPKARRDYLRHPLTRPAAYAMLAYLRRTLPRTTAARLRAGIADAVMAHWGVVTPALCASVQGLGRELYVWTVDDPGRLVELERLGVTGVITNDRDLFTRAGFGAPGES